MEQNEVVYRRKKDFYYIILLMYVLFAIVYILLTGTITDQTVEFGFRDPVVYIIAIFILLTLGALIGTIIRDPRLVITPTRLIFRNRFGERSVYFAHITKIVLKRERSPFLRGTFAVVKLRVPNRLRWIRLRMANYEREKELFAEFRRLKQELHK
ncbi:MAG: hypothetical protein QHI48_09100 [Bacteroidota bacterium]|nr:hypothetical protein [Bacteroidota bacterium]